VARLAGSAKTNLASPISGALEEFKLSKIVKHSMVITGHKTSVSLEEPFWSALKEIARTRRATLSELVHLIDGTYNGGGTSNLSSAIRLFVLDYYREKFSAAVN